MIKRRHLLGIPAGLAASFIFPAQRGLAADATIGWISVDTRADSSLFLAAFKSGLEALPGGKQVTVLDRYATGGQGSVAAMLDELQRQGVSLVVTQGAATLPVAALKPAFPVVFAYSADPVMAGIAQSLARPGGNLTGVTFMSIELNPKRISLLRSAVPDSRRIGLLSNARHAGEELEIGACQRAAEEIGVSLSVHRVNTAEEIQAAVGRALDDGIQALVVLPSSPMVRLATAIAAQCAARKVPVASGWASIARSGALLSYGPNLEAGFRRIAQYAMRVLDGAAPASLPIEQPSVLELVLNMKVAGALGLTMPPSLLAQANEIIE